ncbi:MFS transporter [Sphaerisporangium rufum]|uniref:MFS transporter n=1 Tax=Sphaerisporangium rufum TaxID=1381558 RepID=A0A919UWI8_9ACTN|nr:MFS transporter [Sphaerisporangium rufum]GII76061.1 MFS transporter [Sphaerisporangium rufum]
MSAADAAPAATRAAPAAPPPRRGGLWRDRDFRLLWTGETASAFGSSLTAVAVPLTAVTTLHASAMVVALLTAAAWLPWLIIGLPAGAWIDRLPRRRVMLVCDAVSLVLFASVPVAAWLGLLSAGWLLVVALLAGTASVFFKTAYQAYLPTLVPVARLAEGNAKLQGSESVSQIAGPGAAGLLAQAFGPVNALLADAATFLVSALCLLGIRTREEPLPPPPPDATLRRRIAEGTRFVARDPYLRVLTVFGAASNLFLVGYQAILVVFLIREVGVGPGAVGGLVAATSVGGVAGALLAGPLARRFGSARTMIGSELLGAPFGLLIPMAGPTTAGLVLAVAGGFMVVAGVVTGNIIKGGFRQAYVPRELMGRAVVSMQFVNLGTLPLGAVLGGTLAGALGLRPAMWLMTGGLALTGLILLIGPLRRGRDLPAAPPAPVPRQPRPARGGAR